MKHKHKTHLQNDLGEDLRKLGSIRNISKLSGGRAQRPANPQEIMINTQVQDPQKAGTAPP